MAALPESEHVVFSVPVGTDQGVHYSDVNVKEARPEGPSALSASSDSGFWVSDGVARRLLRFDAQGKLTRTIAFTKDQVAAVDVWADAQHVFALDTSAMEPAVLQYKASGEFVARAALPATLAVEVSGFWDAATEGPWLDLGAKGVLPVMVAPLLRITDAPVAPERAGVTASVEVTGEGGTKGLRVTVQTAQMSPAVPPGFMGARLVRIEGDAAFVQADVESAPGTFARYLLRVVPARKESACARIDAGTPSVNVGHDLTIGADRQAYVARAREKRFEVVRLGWAPVCPGR